MTVWLKAEETYLNTLRETCDELRHDYLQIYETKKNQLYKLKLPAIVLSSVGGFISFGSSNFETSNQNINIVVGTIGLFCAILNTIESFFGLNTTMVSTKATALNLQMLSQRITLELSVDVCDRSMAGIAFLRECFNDFESILKDAVPIVKSKECQDRIKQMSARLSVSSNEASCSPTPHTRPMIIKIHD